MSLKNKIEKVKKINRAAKIARTIVNCSVTDDDMDDYEDFREDHREPWPEYADFYDDTDYGLDGFQVVKIF